MGGLGNQMLQYATGYALAKKKNAALLLDVNYFKIDKKLNNTHREYELSIFHLQHPLYSSILSNYIANKFILKLGLLRKKIMPLLSVHYFTDKDHPAKLQSPVSGTWYLDGYWTNLDYFDEYRADLLRVFDFSLSLNETNRLLATKMENENAVAIHVRRTDYLLPQSSHPALSIEYYKKAINMLNKLAGDNVFYLFGDDHAWIRDNFAVDGKQFIFVDHNTGDTSFMDMALMTKCKHVVISNSTFSWWGAYLNARNGKVIAPGEWFLPGRSPYFNYDNFIPRRWLRIAI
jgi:hypothetical protein